MDKFDQDVSDFYRHSAYTVNGVPCLVEDCPWCKEETEYELRSAFDEDLLS